LKGADRPYEPGTLAADRRDLSLCPGADAGPHLRYPGQQAKDKFIFVGEDGLMPPDDRDLLRYEFRPVLKRLKLYYPGFGWHAFRRQNIAWRQQVGGAAPEAQKAAGHASLDMTYLDTLADTGRETAQVQAMFDFLMGVGEGKPQRSSRRAEKFWWTW
jgi:hypothetical protein